MEAVPTLTVSVLIPTWRRPASLLRGLEALKAQTRLPDEVILIVRSEDEETLAVLADHDLPFPTTVVEPPAPGLIAAINSGLDRVCTDVVVCTDDDTAPRPDWLRRIEDRFVEDPRLGALGGPDRMVESDHPPDGIEGIEVGRVKWYGRIVGNHHLGHGPVRDIEVIKGANFALRTRALGPRRLETDLRGNNTQHNSELGLSLGIKHSGWRLAYDPQVVVDHFEEARHGAARETGMSAEDRSNAVYNQTLGLVRNLPPMRRGAALAYGFLVGSRNNPGVAMALEQHVRAGRPMADELRLTSSARVAALKDHRRAPR